VCDRVVVNRREHDLLALSCESAKDGIDESRRSVRASCADAAHRLINGRADRYAFGAEQLIGTELKRARNQRLEFGEILVDEMAQVVIDLPTPAECSVDEICCKGAIGCVERGAPERRMKQDVRVGTRTRYAFEDA
jgi:hypothetical protein